MIKTDEQSKASGFAKYVTRALWRCLRPVQDFAKTCPHGRQGIWDRQVRPNISKLMVFHGKRLAQHKKTHGTRDVWGTSVKVFANCNLLMASLKRAHWLIALVWSQFVCFPESFKADLGESPLGKSGKSAWHSCWVVLWPRFCMFLEFSGCRLVWWR